jgi:molybdenum cofactor cytidylyltransferase
MEPMEPPDRVAAVILAAGESRRFGSPKQLAVLNGRTLLQHVTDAARDAGLFPVVVVVPPEIVLDQADVLRVPNAQPGLGMSHSLQLGFAALPDDVIAAVILLGDQPTVDAALIRQLVAARGATPFVSTRVNGLLVPPVIVERSHFADVQRLEGDIGLREVLREHARQATAVDQPAMPVDIDSQADLARLVEHR